LIALNVRLAILEERVWRIKRTKGNCGSDCQYSLKGLVSDWASVWDASFKMNEYFVSMYIGDDFAFFQFLCAMVGY